MVPFVLVYLNKCSTHGTIYAIKLHVWVYMYVYNEQCIIIDEVDRGRGHENHQSTKQEAEVASTHVSTGRCV